MIALVAAAPAVCGAREGDAAFWRNEREIIALTQRLKLCEYRLGLANPGKIEKLEGLKSMISENEIRLRGLLSQKAALDAEISSMETRNSASGRMVLEQRRSNTRGMKFDTLPASDGRLFTNATITVVRDSGVEFRHEHGAARLRYSELTDQLRSFFGLEESAASAAEERENRQAIAYEREIHQALEAIRTRETPAIALNEVKSASRITRQLSPVSSREPVDSELSRPAKPIGSARFYQKYRGYGVYRSHRPVYRYVPACIRTSCRRSSACASFTKFP